MSNHLHILGRFRWPIVLLLTFLTTLAGHFIFSKFYSQNDINANAFILRLCLLFFGSTLFYFLITTEAFIRIAIAFVPALFIAVIVYFAIFYCVLAFNSSLDKLGLMAVAGIVAGLSGLVSIVIFYGKLDSSSWIGSRCPECLIRGKLKHEQIGKEFLGVIYKDPGMGTIKNSGEEATKAYNKYLVTTLHTCQSCNHSWQTQCETEERK